MIGREEALMSAGSVLAVVGALIAVAGMRRIGMGVGVRGMMLYLEGWESGS